MKLEIWSDFVCPFCYIGKRRFELALANLPFKEDVKIEFKSFELDPNTVTNNEQPMHEILAAKYNMPVEQAISMNENIAKQAKEVGLDFYFETMKRTNTLDAHRLAKFAEANGKGQEMVERLFKAYFTESKHIANHETLISLAEEIGLNKEATEEMLVSCKYTKKVREEEDQAGQIGVQGVPFFVINEEYGLSGAQPPEVFTEVLTKVWEETNAQKTVKVFPTKNKTTSFCTGDTCQIDEDIK